MPLMFHNGKPLFVNGMLAMGEDCCCDKCLPEAMNIFWEFEYSVGGTGCVYPTSESYKTQLDAHAAISSWSISFTRNGGAKQTLTKTWPQGEPYMLDGSACGDETGPYLIQTVTSSGDDGPFTIRLAAHLTQHGVVDVTFSPGSRTFCTVEEEGSNIIVPGEPQGVNYACAVYVRTENTQGNPPSFNPMFVFGSPSIYSNPYSETRRI